MVDFLNRINAFVWGIPVLILIVAVGVGLTLQSKFFQLRKLPQALRAFTNSFQGRSADADGVPAYRAMCTALAATVGTGNLAGVAGAIAIGGPGAIFWMWISGILGMIIKFSEVVLALHYRKKDPLGSWRGGPMYIITSTLPKRLHYLAWVYCFFGVVASFGVGNTTQVNAVVGGIQSVAAKLGFCIGFEGNLILGCVLGAFVWYAFRTGSARVGKLTQVLVPVAAGAYIVLAIGVLLCCYENIPDAFISIIVGAAKPESVTGGVVGSAFLTLRTGVSRGVFTNESGMGTASIAHAESNTNDPVKQGFLGITEVFLDTIVICTLTALVILSSGVPIPFGTDPGIQLTMSAFSSVYGGWITIPMTGIVCLLAIATILGWGLYGIRCAQFLFGDNVWKTFVLLQIIAVVVGAVMNTSIVWALAEFVNGLMAIPNLIALIHLSPEILRIIKAYRS